MTIIASIDLLPGGPYNGITPLETVGVVITSGVPSFFRVIGADLHNIISVNWYPADPDSLDFDIRGMVLVNNTEGTFMITVNNNYLDITDRGGHISFRMADNSTKSFKVVTFGRVSVTPLWTSPEQGLITG